MMSIRSLADFNGAPLGGAVTGWHRHRHRPGPTLRVDTTKEGWGLLPGHQRGPTPAHQRGLSHGHGHTRGRNWAPERCCRRPELVVAETLGNRLGAFPRVGWRSRRAPEMGAVREPRRRAAWSGRHLRRR